MPDHDRRKPDEPSTRTGEPSTQADEPSTRTGEPSTQAGEPSTQAGEPSTQAGEPSTQADVPSTRTGEPSMTTIGTPRLDLVPLRVEHAEEMAAVLAAPELHAFTGGAPLGPEELRARYERLVAGPPGWRNWVIRLRAEDRLVGYVQATIEGRTAEIAWVIGLPWQGRRLASEAAGALAGLLETQAIDTIVAHIHPDHAASAAVARSAGLRPTGQWHDGELRWERTLGDR
ncbi:GNAT family N-acetyltransferase [Nonomuraea candida]|uniref:GNAT family N-acetyltransferase n=1 Tax=Nonomuraea candida TaxID=359159 RepID=UPI001FE18D1E|nr:GNAT family N-acetyltransferase [Nonomuraea candida]